MSIHKNHMLWKLKYNFHTGKVFVFHNLKHFRASSWCLAVSRGFQSICGCWREGSNLWYLQSFFPPLKDECEEAHWEPPLSWLIPLQLSQLRRCKEY
jgi:hypothetical protein